jgi:DNA-directed RNA polymerase subunit RPC12/RpoP
MKYVKRIPCISCGKEFEIEIPKEPPRVNWKRKCPYCGKRWRVSAVKAFLGNKL